MLGIERACQLAKLLTTSWEGSIERAERWRGLMMGVARIIDAAVAGEQSDAWRKVLRAMTRSAPAKEGVVTTAMRHEVDEELVAALREVGVGDAIVSIARLRAHQRVHGICLYRQRDAMAFREEDRTLVHVFHVACLELLQMMTAAGAHVAQQAGLSPRQQQTLELVLEGLSDKEIAERLGISRYTVNQYTKIIYRHYDVTSRSQLLARLLSHPHAVDSLIVGTDDSFVAA